MQVQVPAAVEKFAVKPPTRKERQIKKLTEKMLKEDRIIWDNMDEKTAELCKMMRAFVDANPMLMGENAEAAREKYFECVAHAQYKALRKEKLVQPKKPKEAKIVKPKTEKVVKPKTEKVVKPKPPKVVEPKPEKIVKSKQVKKPKQKKVKEVKAKDVKQPKPSKEEEMFSLLLQEYQALTDQELAARFVLNQYASQKEPKAEFWCTICEKQFDRLYALNRHLKRKHEAPPATSESSSVVPPMSSSEQSTLPESASSSPEPSIAPDSSLSPEEFMSISLSEDSGED